MTIPDAREPVPGREDCIPNSRTTRGRSRLLRRQSKDKYALPLSLFLRVALPNCTSSRGHCSSCVNLIIVSSSSFLYLLATKKRTHNSPTVSVKMSSNKPNPRNTGSSANPRSGLFHHELTASPQVSISLYHWHVSSQTDFHRLFPAHHTTIDQPDGAPVTTHTHIQNRKMSK